jgi:hypothetical protein
LPNSDPCDLPTRESWEKRTEMARKKKEMTTSKTTEATKRKRPRTAEILDHRTDFDQKEFAPSPEEGSEMNFCCY